MRRALLIVMVGLAGFAVAGLAGVQMLRSWLEQPLAVPTAGEVLEVTPGTSLARVAEGLAKQGILEWPTVLTGWARFTGDASRIKAGEYLLEPGLTPAGLLELLVSGRVILHSLTIVEGWSVRDIVAALHAHPAIVTTLDTRSPDELARRLELGYDSAEGWFFPDTYRFPKGTTDRDMLIRAYRTMQAQVEQAWAQRVPDLPLKEPYELLILASIVERETGLATERPAVAGVFVRRLRIGMRLQTDPTVIYGLGERFDGNLVRRDLEADTPWNTYTRAGLPPTPIAVPGAESLQAVARPAEGTALYFVATGRPDGSHRFSDTLDEHNAAVRSYVNNLRRRAAP